MLFFWMQKTRLMQNQSVYAVPSYTFNLILVITRETLFSFFDVTSHGEPICEQIF